MSVIAFDGKTIAADKQGTRGGNRYTTHKLYRVNDRTIVGYVGNLDHGVRLMEWYCAGAVEKQFPSVAGEDDRATMVVVHDGVLGICYGFTSTIHVVQDVPYAVGSGEDIALGAMHSGASAVQAVEITSDLNIYCGRGVDAFDVEVPKRKSKTRAKK